MIALFHLLLTVMGALLALHAGGQPYFEITASVKLDLIDHKFRCILGPNQWVIEHSHADWQPSYWFTGTNLLTSTKWSNGKTYTHIDATTDGNPGKPGGVGDLMVFDEAARIFWLTCCSGPALKAGAKLYPPSDLWKEVIASPWSQKVTTLQEKSGLPESVTLVTTNNVAIFSFATRSSTNVAGCEFPLSFLARQHYPFNENHSPRDFMFSGRINSIKPVERMDVPADLRKLALGAAAH